MYTFLLQITGWYFIDGNIYCPHYLNLLLPSVSHHAVFHFFLLPALCSRPPFLLLIIFLCIYRKYYRGPSLPLQLRYEEIIIDSLIQPELQRQSESRLQCCIPDPAPFLEMSTVNLNIKLLSTIVVHATLNNYS